MSLRLYLSDACDASHQCMRLLFHLMFFCSSCQSDGSFLRGETVGSMSSSLLHDPAEHFFGGMKLMSASVDLYRALELGSVCLAT